jgi:hypothetical protein
MGYMHHFLLVSSLAAAAISTTNVAFAEEFESFVFVSTKSRGEVRAEMQASNASGVNPSSDTYNQLASFTGNKTRDEVRAEFMSSRQETQALLGEDSGSTYLATASHGKAPHQASRQIAASQ